MIGVWYFSATGNGKKLAERIVTELSDVESEIIDITSYEVRNTINKIINYDTLILLFPIYAGDVPNVLKKFYKQLSGSNTRTVLITLWGNIHTTNGLYHASEILRNRGFLVVAGLEVVAEHSYNNDKLKLGLGRPTEAEIGVMIQFIRKSLKKDTAYLFKKKRRTIMMLLPQSFIPRKMVKLETDRETCISCKICLKKCPVNAIDTDMKIDNRKCIRCLACVYNCPKKARHWSFQSPMAQKHLSKYQLERECNYYS